MENFPQSCNTAPTSQTTTRRTFLQHCSLPAWVALSSTLALLLTPPLHAQEKPIPTTATPLVEEPSISTKMPRDQFNHMAQLLSGREKLDKTLLEKAFLALQRNNPKFESMLNELHQLIDVEEIASAQAFMENKAVAKQPAAIECAKQIISALYTGRVGQGSKAELISYEQALMYQPTIDITVIPSYSRGGRDYWIQAPI